MLGRSWFFATIATRDSRAWNVWLRINGEFIAAVAHIRAAYAANGSLRCWNLDDMQSYILAKKKRTPVMCAPKVSPPPISWDNILRSGISASIRIYATSATIRFDRYTIWKNIWMKSIRAKIETVAMRAKRPSLIRPRWYSTIVSFIMNQRKRFWSSKDNIIRLPHKATQFCQAPFFQTSHIKKISKTRSENNRNSDFFFKQRKTFYWIRTNSLGPPYALDFGPF